MNLKVVINTPDLVKQYGIGKNGRYRVMRDTQVAAFFMELGWKPKYDLKQRRAEIEKRMEDGLTRKEAEWDIDEEIQSDLELFTMLRFAKVSSIS
jgi:hypothetical protein